MEQQQTLTPAILVTMKEREPLRTLKLVAKRLAVSFSYDSKTLSLSVCIFDVVKVDHMIPV